MVVDQYQYPVRYDVDYTENLSRLSTFFLLFTIIPISIVAVVLVANGGAFGFLNPILGAGTAVSGTLVLVPLLMIIFRRKYPRWWFDWNLEFLRFSARFNAYFGLLVDEYPSTDDEQSVHLEMDYPDVEQDLNRWLPLIKWLLAIPHLIVLAFLAVAAFVLIVISWFAILFTGSYPRPFFDFVVGVTRWGIRVQAYALLMVTDRYPPFSLS